MRVIQPPFSTPKRKPEQTLREPVFGERFVGDHVRRWSPAGYVTRPAPTLAELEGDEGGEL